MSYTFKHSICNEAFQEWDFAEACKVMRGAGYQGIEIAPFTLAEDPASVTSARRRELRDIICSEGLTFVGLHWLMVSPKGLHVTTPEAAVRTRSWLHVRSLIDLCADLGTGGVMIFGSPKQRGSTGGMSGTESAKVFADLFASLAPHALERGVTLLIEALPSKDCDTVNSLDEAAELVKSINHPAVRTMFDVHNAISETEPHHALVDRHFDFIRHVHINELDGKHPGAGTYDFAPLFDVLRRRDYRFWVSLEAFDFSFGAETIARDTMGHVESVIAKLPLEA